MGSSSAKKDDGHYNESRGHIRPTNTKCFDNLCSYNAIRSSKHFGPKAPNEDVRLDKTVGEEMLEFVVGNFQLLSRFVSASVFLRNIASCLLCHVGHRIYFVPFSSRYQTFHIPCRICEAGRGPGSKSVKARKGCSDGEHTGLRGFAIAFLTLGSDLTIGRNGKTNCEVFLVSQCGESVPLALRIAERSRRPRIGCSGLNQT